jgi:hypothetical protein
VKKLIAITLTLVLIVTLFAVYAPNVALSGPGESPKVFESAFTITPEGDHPLDEGEVSVSKNGTVKIKIKGAADNQVYRAFLNSDDCTGCPGVNNKCVYRLGDFTTDANGYGTLEMNLSAAIPLPCSPPLTEIIRKPTFVIFAPGAGPKFITGFEITSFAIYPPIDPGGPKESPKVFEADLIAVVPESGHTLSDGEITIAADDTLKIKVEGAKPLQKYMAFLQNGKCPDCPQLKYVYILGPFTTDANGYGTLEMNLSAAIPFTPPTGPPSPPLPERIEMPAINILAWMEPGVKFMNGFDRPVGP